MKQFEKLEAPVGWELGAYDMIIGRDMMDDLLLGDGSGYNFSILGVKGSPF